MILIKKTKTILQLGNKESKLLILIQKIEVSLK